MPNSLEGLPLPAGVRSRYLDNVNGITVHFLEAGFGSPDRPCLLLVHGFPELAFSWRKVLPLLAQAGFHVIAPDQRGFGRSSCGTRCYDADYSEFRMPNLARDACNLLDALGIRSVTAVIGHDSGASVAAWCALQWPDRFRSLVMMSAPFAGVPDRSNATSTAGTLASVVNDLGKLTPPRKHYQWYFSTEEANADMLTPKQGLRDFLRAYFHIKSADHASNQPRALEALTAEALAQLPTYYVMRADQSMADTAAEAMPSQATIRRCFWLTDAELDVYVGEYSRTGFQAGLQTYRCATSASIDASVQKWAGSNIGLPSCFIAGRSDWGTYQKPGAFEKMRDVVCTQMREVHFLEGAGHWVQQEQPIATTELLVNFLSRV